MEDVLTWTDGTAVLPQIHAERQEFASTKLVNPVAGWAGRSGVAMLNPGLLDRDDMRESRESDASIGLTPNAERTRRHKRDPFVPPSFV